MRTTVKNMTSAMERLAIASGHKIATNYSDVGAWELDYNPTYGGARINEIVNEHGGITAPLGDRRSSPAMFCFCCEFAIRALKCSLPS